MPLNYDTTSPRTPCPSGTYPATCVQVVELGMQPGYKDGPAKSQVFLAFELDGPVRDDGALFTVGKRFTVSLFVKASLYEVVDSLLGKVPTAKEFNPAHLLGKACLVKVIHKQRADGSLSALVDSVVGLPASMEAPMISQNLLFYDWTSPDRKVYAQLPEWLRSVIDAGGDQPKTPAKKAAGSDVDPNDDIPW